MSLNDFSFVESKIKVRAFNFKDVHDYDLIRNFPVKDMTSYLSPHLRFGTISVRECVSIALKKNETFLSELIWREFFMQIMFHFPHVVTDNFKPKYDGIQWRNNKDDFKKWCNGQTGYPLVDAGMRQLNETGYMHNRVRMVTASFLIKHLMIDWRWGEAYFAKKLLDFDLSANNGNWQWSAGTGCDSSPYFRIFNPIEQLKKFDKDLTYTRKWVQDFDELTYPKPMVDHKEARERCLLAYKSGIG
jgi:deoxyribodipyrimidine photo-lyase